MARHPVSDERSVVPPFEKARNFGRIFTKELARYLGAQPVALVRFLRQRGLLQRGWVREGGHGSATAWTSPRGAALAIAHFREKQGAKVMAGKDPFVERDRDKLRQERRRLRKKAGEVQAQLAGVLKRDTAHPELDE